MNKTFNRVKASNFLEGNPYRLSLMKLRRILVLTSIATVTINVAAAASSFPTLAELKDRGASAQEYFEIGFFGAFARAETMDQVAFAIPYLKTAYEMGYTQDPRLFDVLGLSYRDGVGTNPNNILAAKIFRDGVEGGSVHSAIHLYCLDNQSLDDEGRQSRIRAFQFLKSQGDEGVGQMERFQIAYFSGTLNQPENVHCAYGLAEILKDLGNTHGSLFWGMEQSVRLINALANGRSHPISEKSISEAIAYTYKQTSHPLEKQTAAAWLWLMKSIGLDEDGPSVQRGDVWLQRAAEAGSPDAQTLIEIFSNQGQMPENPRCQLWCDTMSQFWSFRQEISNAESEYLERKRQEENLRRQQALAQQRAIIAAQQAEARKRERRRRFWDGVITVLGAAAGAYIAHEFSTTPSRSSYTNQQPQGFKSSSATDIYRTARSSVAQKGDYCSFQSDCGTGLYCIKANSSDFRGICGVTTTEFGLRDFQELKSWPDMQAQSCRFLTDCPVGFNCKKTGALHGVCVQN